MKTKASQEGSGNSAPARRDCTASEREWLRTALHDGLGQLLTSISFLASSLNQKLAARQLPEATEAAELLALAGRAIGETKALVREKPSVQAAERQAADKTSKPQPILAGG